MPEEKDVHVLLADLMFLTRAKGVFVIQWLPTERVWEFRSEGYAYRSVDMYAGIRFMSDLYIGSRKELEEKREKYCVLVKDEMCDFK